MMDDKIHKIFLVAGESSGDALGARLMRSMKEKSNLPLKFFGIGGPMMEEEGLNSLFPMSELSLMGLVEILPHIRQLKKRVLQTAEAANKIKPDAIITIDSPGFAHAFIKRVHVETLKIHYVAPSVWAWKPKRVFKFKKHYDHILALLPFEPKYFEKVKLPCHFVGHSIIESGADCGDNRKFREQENIESNRKILLLLPGSRKGEAQRLLPIFKLTIEKLNSRVNDLVVVIPAVDHLRDFISKSVKDWNCDIKIIDGKNQVQKYDAMAAADVALAASGTVGLETAMAKLPTVIAYKISPITYAMVRRFVKVDFGHLLNILADRMIIPEFIQKDCIPEKIYPALVNILDDENLPKQITQVDQLLTQLKPKDKLPSQEAARVVLSLLEENQI